MRPINALGRLVCSLGVPADGVPADPDEASALYRSRLVDQRMQPTAADGSIPPQSIHGGRWCQDVWL